VFKVNVSAVLVILAFKHLRYLTSKHVIAYGKRAEGTDEAVVCVYLIH